MKNNRKYFKCELCGNLVGKIKDSGVDIVCCGQNMTHLVPNTTDAAQEKHVPVCSFEDGKLVVNVGSVLHPMTEEHHISWIAVAQGNLTQRIELSHIDSPSATFTIGEGPATVYAYCNLHGLWSAEA